VCGHGNRDKATDPDRAREELYENEKRHERLSESSIPVRQPVTKRFERAPRAIYNNEHSENASGREREWPRGFRHRVREQAGHGGFCPPAVYAVSGGVASATSSEDE
jgi:hypothetical protein